MPSDGTASPGSALTFDVEAWFHAHNLRIRAPRWHDLPMRLDRPIEAILALLERHGTSATFFVLGWVARRKPELVRSIQRAGHEIASHGYGHRPVHDLSRARFRTDVRASKAILEDIIGCAVSGYRAPAYSIGPRTPWAIDILEEEGFLYDSSIYPARAPHGRYGVPDAPLRPHRIGRRLWEFPLPTVSFAGLRLPVATGAYFRLLPLPLTRLAVRRNLRAAIPVVVNIHPWELDPDQPRQSIPLGRRLLHYTNLHTTRRKLARLLTYTHFAPLRELHAMYDATQATKSRRQLGIQLGIHESGDVAAAGPTQPFVDLPAASSVER